MTLPEYEITSQQKNYLPYKRALDHVFSLFGLIPMFFVMMIVIVCNAVHGVGCSVFFSQTRIGKNGIPFIIYKFRTMVPNAEEHLTELLTEEDLELEWKQYQKLSNDPRVTKLGKFLRRTSLDELPQFWNVLKGDMSLIGPRPLVPGELEEHGGNSLYTVVRPGMTSWWAVHGRSNVDYEKRLELEYEYIRNFSFRMDLKCFF